MIFYRTKQLFAILYLKSSKHETSSIIDCGIDFFISCPGAGSNQAAA